MECTRKARHRLTYASGGHPPALLLAGPDPSAVELRVSNRRGRRSVRDVDLPFESAVLDLDACARILVFSDSVYEIEKTDGENWDFDQFLRFMAATGPDGDAMERLLAHTRQLHGSEHLRMTFPCWNLSSEAAPCQARREIGPRPSRQPVANRLGGRNPIVEVYFVGPELSLYRGTAPAYFVEVVRRLCNNRHVRLLSENR